jgi:outer membrane receptor protein involved in Fe transport
MSKIIVIIMCVIVSAGTIIAQAETGSSHNVSDTITSGDSTEGVVGVDKKTELTKVVVTGKQKRNVLVNPRVETKSIAASISEIDKKEIQERSAATLVDALRYSTGVQLRMQGRKVKDFITFRNQSAAEFAVDGIWQRDFTAVPTFFSTNDIERIEVLRSSAILLNSVSGLNGLINIVPKQYDTASIDGQVVYGQNKTYAGRFSAGSKYHKVHYALAAGVSSTDGPKDMNAAEKIYDISGRLKYNASEKLMIQGNVFYFSGKREMKISDPNTTTFSQKDWQYNPVTSMIANMQGLYQWSTTNSTQLQLYLSSRQSTFAGSVLQGSGPKGKYTTNFSDEIDKEFGATATHAVQLFENNTLRLGLLYNRWHVPFGKLSYNGKEYETEDLAIAAIDEYKIGKIDIGVGGRITKTHILHSNFNPKSDPFWQKASPEIKAGVNYQLIDDAAITLSGTYGYVKPDPGMIDTTKTEIKGLENEQRVEIDAGVVVAPQYLGKVSAGVFLLNQSNGINSFGLDSTRAGTPQFPIVTGFNRDQYTWGLECEVRSKPLVSCATVFVNATYYNSYAKYNGEFVPDTTKPSIIANAGLTIKKWNADIDIVAKHVSAYYSNSFMPAGTVMKVGDFNIFDINCGYSFGTKEKIRLFASVKNVLDRHYYTIAGYPDDGRFVKCGLQFNY